MAQRPQAAPKQAVVTEETANNFRRFRDQLTGLMPIAKKMLPTHIDPQKFEAIVISAIQSNPALLDCEPRSLLTACRELAELGLSLSKQRREADILPRWNSKINGKEAQLQIRYGGLMTLAKRSGEIRSISSTAVREGDHFVYERGMTPKLEHKPVLNNKGALIAAYCVWTLADGTRDFELVEIEDIDRAKRASQSRNRDGVLIGPWVDDEEEQWRKTAIRRASKYMPSSAEDFQKAVQMDTLRDVGHEVKLEDGDVIDVTEQEPTPVNRQEAATKQLDRLEHKVSVPLGGTPVHPTQKPVAVQQQRQAPTTQQQKAQPPVARHQIAVIDVRTDEHGQPDYDGWVIECLAAIPAGAGKDYLDQWRDAHDGYIEGADMVAPDVIDPLLKRLGSV